LRHEHDRKELKGNGRKKRRREKQKTMMMR